MNLEHHSEQMEAARRDFDKLWNEKLELRAVNMGARDERTLSFAQDIAWQAFLHGLQIKSPIDNRAG